MGLIQAEQVKIHVFNSMSREVVTSDAGVQEAGLATQIDVRHLASGIYLLMIKVGSQNYIKRFVKE